MDFWNILSGISYAATKGHSPLKYVPIFWTVPFIDENTKVPRKRNDLPRAAQQQGEKAGWDYYPRVQCLLEVKCFFTIVKEMAELMGSVQAGISHLILSFLICV